MHIFITLYNYIPLKYFISEIITSIIFHRNRQYINQRYALKLMFGDSLHRETNDINSNHVEILVMFIISILICNSIFTQKNLTNSYLTLIHFDMQIHISNFFIKSNSSIHILFYHNFCSSTISNQSSDINYQRNYDKTRTTTNTIL